MSGEGSQSSLSVIEEVTWGVTPGGDMQGVNFTSEDMSMKIDNQISDNIRADRQTADLVQTGASTEGGFETEAQFGNLKDLMEGFFWDNFQTDVGIDGAQAGTNLLVNGVLKKSYTIQRSNNDISQYFIYKGMTPNTIEWNIETGSTVTVNLGFIGKDETLSQVHVTETPPVVTPIINAVTSITAIAIDGAPLTECLVQKVSVMLDNKAEGKTGIGVLGYCAVDGKSIEVTGSISMYFNDQAQYQKYIASGNFSLKITFQDTSGNEIVLFLPFCKYDEATANVTGKDDSVMFEATYVAIMNPVAAPDNYTIALEETPV